MKWVLELSDVPEDSKYPIKGVQFLDNGVKRGPFYFSVKDLVDALNTTHKEIEGLDEQTPILPNGTIRYGTNGMGTKHRITMEIPKKIWDIQYQGNFYTVGFPRMIVQYLIHPVDQYFLIREMYIFAIEENASITEDTKLYYFPYPNVYKDSGKVCWGNNEKLKIKSFSELERIFFWWFVSAPFNDDLGVHTTLGMSNFKMLLEKIKDKPFEDDWLLPSSKRFGDLG